MSLFDFPRINFSGNLAINVATINNTYYFPLTVYDAVNSVAFCPPRLYFSTIEKINEVSSSINPAIYYDSYNKYYYIEIETVNTPELIQKWCMTPISDCPDTNKFDFAYVPYYVAACKDLRSEPLLVGSCPGYWNMFGDMGMYFSDVGVTGVQVQDQGYNVQTYTNDSQNVPEDIAPLLTAKFDTDAQPGAGNTTSLLIETISNQSVYASVFTSNVNLYNDADKENPFLSGIPFRFAASIYNSWRVLNWWPPMAGSARFSSSIPMDQISDGDQSALMQFFTANTNDPRPIKGVYVSFCVTEVFEKRFDQSIYIEKGIHENPAQCITVGTISPWYEEDLKAGIMGRQLISMNMATTGPNNTLLAPAICQLKKINDNLAVFSIDMGNTIPEAISPGGNKKIPREEATFDTFDYGTLFLTTTENIADSFAQIDVTPSATPRKRVHEIGGVFDKTITDPNTIKAIEDNYINVFLKDNSTKVLSESPYMMGSDQKGLYVDQGDLPEDGYRSFSEVKEPCVIRIYQRGIPVTTPISVGIVKYDVPEAGNDSTGTYSVLNWVPLKDKDVAPLICTEAVWNDNAIFYFIYDNQYPNNIPPKFAEQNYTIMDTGSFVCLRVHQNKDLEQYINQANWGTTPPTYEVVYENVFKLYDIVYPAMGLVHPFSKEQWNNGAMAGRTVQRTDPHYWNSILYMPRSRELSNNQRRLIQAWAAYLKTQV